MLEAQAYSESWICLNCRNVGPLTAHGRCATCDSDSVAVADMGRSVARDEVEELERLFQTAAQVPFAKDLLSPGRKRTRTDEYF